MSNYHATAYAASVTASVQEELRTRVDEGAQRTHAEITEIIFTAQRLLLEGKPQRARVKRGSASTESLIPYVLSDLHNDIQKAVMRLENVYEEAIASTYESELSEFAKDNHIKEGELDDSKREHESIVDNLTDSITDKDKEIEDLGNTVDMLNVRLEEQERLVLV